MVTIVIVFWNVIDLKLKNQLLGKFEICKKCIWKMDCGEKWFWRKAFIGKNANGKCCIEKNKLGKVSENYIERFLLVRQEFVILWKNQD